MKTLLILIGILLLLIVLMFVFALILHIKKGKELIDEVDEAIKKYERYN